MRKSPPNKRERAAGIIEDLVIPAIKKKDLDYNKTLNYISGKSGISVKAAEEILKTAILTGKIKEVRVLTVSDHEVDGFLKEMVKREKEINSGLNSAFGEKNVKN